MVPRIAWVYVEFTEEVHLRQFFTMLKKVESNVVFAKNTTQICNQSPLKTTLAYLKVAVEVCPLVAKPATHQVETVLIFATWLGIVQCYQKTK